MFGRMIIFVLLGIFFVLVDSSNEKNDGGTMEKLVNETSNSFSGLIKLFEAGMESGIKIGGHVLTGITGVMKGVADKMIEILGLKSQMIKDGVEKVLNVSKNIFGEVGNFTKELGAAMKKLNASRNKMDAYEKEVLKEES